jgi:UDP-N-acetylmuramyl pentapeptide synthase
MFRADELVTAIGGTLVEAAGSAHRRDLDRYASFGAGRLVLGASGRTVRAAAFVDDALAKGACGWFCGGRCPRPAPAKGERSSSFPCETLHALRDAASAYRARFRLPVVAVTGSNGKTTTRWRRRFLSAGAGAGPAAISAIISGCRSPLRAHGRAPRGGRGVGVNHPGR